MEQDGKTIPKAIPLTDPWKSQCPAIKNGSNFSFLQYIQKRPKFDLLKIEQHNKTLVLSNTSLPVPEDDCEKNTSQKH